MILCDSQIKKLAMDGMVQPYEESLVNPASIDVRLGPRLLIEVEYTREMQPLEIVHHVQQDPYWMAPGQFLLAETIETFNLPADVAAQFMLKSSRAREGLEHLLAGYCDPGWHGSRLTMELHNSRQLHSVPIWHGMKIGQMVFHRMSETPAMDYSKTGRYNNHKCVTASLG
jgi:dCTP deaminase